MRIVNKQEFYKLPHGTLYSEYEPCLFKGLKIKQENIVHDGEPEDFFYEDLIGNVDANSSAVFIEILEKCEKDKSEFDLNFEDSSRDGLFEDDALYAVYNTAEIFALSKKIAGCKGCELNAL